jgi:hypothetical protein
MLRNLVLTVGGALLITGIFGILAGHIVGGITAIVWGAMMTFGIVYERYAYKTVVAKAPTGKHWVQTPERFIDKKTGKTVVVYYNRMSGERTYVAVTSD